MLTAIKKIQISLVFLFLIPWIAYSQDKGLQDAIRLTKSEQFSAADQAFKKLVQEYPNDGDVYFFYGDNFLKEYFSDTLNIPLEDKAISAKKLFEQGVQADPANPVNFVGLGEVALLTKDPAQAQAYFDKAISLLPTKKNKISMSKERHARTLVKMADAYVLSNVKDTSRVFSLLREAEELDRKNYELYIVRGDAAIFLLNNGSMAIANYNIAQTYNPTSPMAKLRTGQLWLRAKQYQLALDAYQQLVQIDPTFAPAYRELGFLMSKAGRNDEAKQNFIKFLELSGGNITARTQFINILIELQDYQDAINQINAILATDTSIVDLYRALAYSDYEQQAYEDGLQAMKKFFARAEKEKIRSTDYSYYGRLLAKLGNDSLAPLMLMKAFEIDTTKPELLSEAAMCYNRSKNYEKAIGLYNRKIALNKENAMDYYNLGKDYYNLQNYQMADSVFAIFNRQQPAYITGFIWRARTNANLDPESDLGLAKPVYESILEISREDTLKYVKERMESYYYLAYYYFKQYNLTKDKENAFICQDYCNLILLSEPTGDKADKANQMLDALKKNKVIK